jgi:predicted ATP-dependent Lon-type protease
MLETEKNKWYTWGKPYGISKGEWDAEIDARALMAINRYDKSKDTMLSTHMFNAFKFVAKDIQKLYNVGELVTGLEDRAFENLAQNVGRISGGEASVSDAFYEVQTSTGDQVVPKDVLLREEFGIPESNTVEINDIIKDKIPTLKMNLKDLET